MEAIRQALEIEDPEPSLDAVIGASCAIWESQAFVHEQLQAIVVLEPDASVLIDQQRQDQRADLQLLVRRLSRSGKLRSEFSEPRATATLHMLTSPESFLWLRRHYGLSLRRTRETITELARTLLRG
jgi:hypothetical protein